MSAESGRVLLPILLRRVAPGVWGAPSLPDDAQHQLPGWRVLDLDLADVSDRAQTLALLGQAGGFPDHYGQNWDAAYDCLTDLALDLVLIRNSAALDPDVSSTLDSVMDDAVAFWSGRKQPVFVLWDGRTDRQQLPNMR